MRRRRISRFGLVLAVTALASGLSACDAPALADLEDVDAVERRMAELGVPGASVALIDDFEIVGADGYGVTQTAGGSPVRSDTLFQTMSVGKPVTAVAALVQVGQQRLDLDADATTYLTGWTLPDGAQSEADPVTLRALLSHTAGTTVGGYDGYPRGAVLPTLTELLDGRAPATSPPVRVEIPPGREHRYSNGGYLIVQQVLEDVTATRFADLVNRTVFDPLGMTDSHYCPLTPDLAPQAASGHRTDGTVVPGQWRVFPEHAPAGFWTTSTDLALFGIDIMRAWQGEAGTVLPARLATDMLTPNGLPIAYPPPTSTPAPLSPYGLGFAVIDDGGNRLHLLHDGGNKAGQVGFQSKIVLYPERGQGLVVLTNSDDGDLLIDELIVSQSTRLGWYSGFILSPVQTTLLVAVALTLVAAAVAWARRRHRHSTQQPTASAAADAS